jgi:hypothetical protein
MATHGHWVAIFDPITMLIQPTESIDQNAMLMYYKREVLSCSLGVKRAKSKKMLAQRQFFFQVVALVVEEWDGIDTSTKVYVI